MPPVADFLAHPGARPWSIPAGGPQGFSPQRFYLGAGAQPLEVAVANFDNGRPTVQGVRELWKRRMGNAAAPLMLVVLYRLEERTLAALCGPVGQDPAVHMDLEVSQVQRVASAALREPSRHAAIRFLAATLPQVSSDMPGLLNEGLFAAHELRRGVQQRPDWPQYVAVGQKLLALRGRDLVEALGFAIENRGVTTHVLRIAENGTACAIALFLDQEEQPDLPSARFPDTSPVMVALQRADEERLPYVLVTRGGQVRVYATGTDVGVGRKGRTETFLEVDLTLIPETLAGYLPLLFGANALKPGGSFEQVLDLSRTFAAELGERLRERVYREVVPQLAEAVAAHVKRKDPAELYEMAMLILFRLLFVAYAEDKGLLPYRTNGMYQRHALKTLARDMADRANDGDFHFDEHATDLWTDILSLWRAVDRGNTDWGVPAYNGGLFSTDEEQRPLGAALAQLTLTNAEVGPALFSLLVDDTEEHTFGPVDFRSLTVREFGTIYEGLLESTLARAAEDLAVDRQGLYVPAGRGQEVVVAKGAVYLQNRSGARKSTGSYFTKHFAVEHLLDHALEPALDRHVAHLELLAAAGKQEEVGRLFFDFRVADLSMGSGHFLVAAVDRIEARLSGFLAVHATPQVVAELDGLRAAAMSELKDLAASVQIEASALLRRQIARRCVYGVDLNEIAVELARLSIWIHTFVPGLPLSFLDHTLVHGNSLVGVGSLEEVIEFLEDEGSEQEGPSLFADVVLDKLRKAEGALGRLARATDATAKEVKAAAAAHRESLERVQPARDLFDLITYARIESTARPEVLEDDAIARSRHLKRARAYSERLQALHFPAVFPEVFLREKSGFDCIIGNPPWKEATFEADQFWRRHDPQIRSMEARAAARRMEELSTARPDLQRAFEAEQEAMTEARQALVAGPYPGMSDGDPDLYKAFLWRFWGLANSEAALGVVLPHSVFASMGSSTWRQVVLSQTQSKLILTKNEREWLFTDVNPGYSIVLFSANRVRTEDASIQVSGTFKDLGSFLHGKHSGALITFEALRRFDPLVCIPAVESKEEFALFQKLIVHPSFGAARPDFAAFPVRELDATNDKGFFKSRGHPVYNHLNVGHFQFNPEAGAFASANFNEVTKALQQKRVRSLRSRRSGFSAMPAKWITDPSTLPARNARIVFRDVVHASNPRKVWAALAPADTLLTNASPYLVFAKGDLPTQAYVLGMLGSSVCDWFGHQRVVLHLSFFILNSIPLPLFDAADPRAARVAEIAAGLAVGGEGSFGEWADLAARSRQEDPAEAVAELDALASLLYGLTDDLLPLIWTENGGLRPALSRVRAFRAQWSSQETHA